MLGYLVFALGRYTENDVAAYHKLVEGDGESEDRHSSRQKRQGVQKDIYFTDEGQRRHLHLESADAHLAFEKREGNVEIIEQMNGLTCYLQDETPLKTVLTGQADKLEMRYGEDLGFQADGFQAHMQGFPQDEGMIQAGHVDYDGKRILLTQKVDFQNPFGKLLADRAIVLSNGGSSDLDQVELEGGVTLSLRQGGQLSCTSALLDSKALTGNFRGDSQGNKVVYTHALLMKNQQLVPLKASSQSMAVKLIEIPVKTSRKHVVAEITAQDDVSISYQNFHARGDKAVYQRDRQQISDHPLILPGKITLYGGEQGTLCRIIRGTDEINAKQIDFDTTKKVIHFSQPDGVLTGSKESPPIKFSSDFLEWNEESGILTLTDNVQVNQEGIGRVETVKQIRFYQQGGEGQKTFRGIETEGDTFLTYHDDKLSHTLRCTGPLKVDHQKGETRLFSRVDPSGKITEAEQVTFEDAKGKVYADRALIKYSYTDKKIVPKKIVLLGNVKIENYLPLAQDEYKKVMQYLLAERVEFYPQTKEMFFNAHSGGRVLFFDKTKNLQVSAPSLKIVRDKATQKESIQGYGDVRFNFVEHEFEQLRKRFSLDKNKKSGA